ncbi:hypothetical protein CEXT_75521 [Caerostris extrusa]|uniref:Uncharacterized protein n=1 Tax=Caerostris extrusa TaxID=172846 RepID=A0AAV4XV67_CAEEX|nr:hypothetical protein CEXT_75521 [Caerostris extrusa]
MRIATAFGLNLPYVYVVSSERINEKDETTGSRPIVSKIPSAITEELLQLSKHKILTLQDIDLILVSRSLMCCFPCDRTFRLYFKVMVKILK